MKGDKSKKVGSCKQSKGPEAQKSSMVTKPRGRAVLLSEGRKTYTDDGRPSTGRPVKHKPTRRIR